MEKTKLEKYAEIQPMVQKEVRDIATQVYKEMAAKYGVAEVPYHEHNGVDSAKIPPSSLTSYIPIDVSTVGTVFKYATSIGQGIFAAGITPGILPLVVISGGGVPPADEFQGGEADDGTIVVFTNVDTLAVELWVKVGSFWRGVDLPLSAPAVV